MDGSRFDAWTRRRFGVIAGGLAASLLGVASPEDAGTRRKKRKKNRCREVTQSCGGKKKCCKSLDCDKVGLSSSTFCCRAVQQTCNGDTGQCCRDRVCDRISGLSGFRCCGIQTSPCSGHRDCCENFLCNNEGRCIEV